MRFWPFTAGAGGTDSQDGQPCLNEMYLRWIENHNYKADILDITEGEEPESKA
jgi:peptide chain release factor 2